MLIPVHTPGRRKWTPARIPGLVAWWDARYLTGIADGGSVSSVPDRSGKGNALAQAVGVNQPAWRDAANGINGRPALEFGTDDFLTCDALGGMMDGDDAPWTVFAAVMPSYVNLSAYLFSWGDTAGTAYAGGLAKPANDSLQVYGADGIGGTGDRETPINSFLSGQNYRLCVRREGATVSAWIGDTLHVDAAPWDLGSLALFRFTVGARRYKTVGAYWGGKVGTILVCDRSLLDGEVARVNAWMGREWGIS